MPLVVPGVTVQGGKNEEWMDKLMGKKIGEATDEVVSSLLPTYIPTCTCLYLHVDDNHAIGFVTKSDHGLTYGRYFCSWGLDLCKAGFARAAPRSQGGRHDDHGS